MTTTKKPRVSVHKFASCSGCQLAFINMGENLIKLTELVDIVHFAEAGALGPDDDVDISFIEGSITTPHDVERLEHIREHSTYVITVGACATSGGIQALKNNADSDVWMRSVYAKPEYISSLSTSAAIKNHVKVDFELWGCPVDVRQMLATVRQLLFGVMPVDNKEKVCQECKRRGTACIMVTKKEPCMGPVTRTGCGALCPSYGAACYACYGPAENTNVKSLGNRFIGFGLDPNSVKRKFLSIHSATPEFSEANTFWTDTGGVEL
ncbi:sulfhydrogenase subunit delta [Teredinibacter haidensis]|uniref:NADH-quinone oxidoreductase subunit B family protein n=1 Tax=Teredinibacter haidensis TaxID=2731755 RepID=UPI000948BA7C|nr:sulfhydrogenase subunit delta [Teredinibacter haidensis]